MDHKEKSAYREVCWDVFAGKHGQNRHGYVALVPLTQVPEFVDGLRSDDDLKIREIAEEVWADAQSALAENDIVWLEWTSSSDAEWTGWSALNAYRPGV